MRVLVVDDEWPILELLRFKLGRQGYEVVTAKNEKEFWQEAFDRTPDLIILDIWLKNKVGTDIYHNMLNFGLDPKIPVIFMTALMDSQPPKHAPSGGRYALYTKPFDFDELFKEIHKLLRTRRTALAQ